MEHAPARSRAYYTTRAAARGITYTTLAGAFFTLPPLAVAAIWHLAARGLGL